MSDIIPTAEEAASAAHRLDRYLAVKADTPLYMRRAIDTVLPLLEAIAAGRVFEVRPERCAMCRGRGHSSFQDDGVMVIHDCPRCDGSGYEPAPPGRKQRTAYDAMIEAATGDGTLSGSTQPSGEASATLLAPAPPSGRQSIAI